MKKIFTILFALFSLVCLSQTSLTVSQIGSSTDYSRPSHTRWNNQTVGSGQAIPGMEDEQMFYRRYSWADLEGSPAGSWRFDERVRPDIEAAIDVGATFNMGIMTLYPDGGNSFNNINNISGANCTYPVYLHNLMQSSGASDFLTNNNWVPNYNHPDFIDRFRELHIELRSWIETESYTPGSGPHAGQEIFFRDVLKIFDVRGVGVYGEMHHANLGSPYNEIDVWEDLQPGRFPTIDTWKELIDIQVDAFDDYKCTFIMNILDNMRFANTRIPSEVGYYALTKQNNKGLCGYRRDQWSDPGSYYRDISIESGYTYEYEPDEFFEFDTSTQNRYKFAPITGEPINDACCNGNCANVVDEFEDYHAWGVGNGNYSAGLPTGSCATHWNNAFKRQGSRITITSGTITTTLTQNSTFNITVNWQNLGITPEYFTYETVFQFRDQGTDDIEAEFTSDFTPEYFLPGTAVPYSENFNLGPIPTGTYRLVVLIRDPAGYLIPYPIGITGRESDGAYELLNNITVNAGGGGGNEAPVANAGADQTITLPDDDVTVSASGSTDDVAILSYLWTKISGPSSFTIVDADEETTDITDLTAGTYVFRVTVDDGQFTDSDDVTIVVQDTPPTPPAGSFRSRRRIYYQQ